MRYSQEHRAVTELTETIKALANQDSNALSELLKTGKELFSTLQARGGSMPESKQAVLTVPAEEKGQANVTSSNNQPAFFPPAPGNTQNTRSNPEPQVNTSSSSSVLAENQVNRSPFVADIATTLIKSHNVLTVAQAPSLKDKLQRLFDAHPDKEQVNALPRKERLAFAQSVANELKNYVNELRTGNSCDEEFTGILSEQCAALARGQKQVMGAIA